MGNCFFFWPNVIFFQFRTNFVKDVFVPNALQKICKFHFAHIAFGTKNLGTIRLPIENQDVLEKKTAQFLLTHGQDTHIKENNILKSKNGILRGWVNGKVFFFYHFHNVTFLWGICWCPNFLCQMQCVQKKICTQFAKHLARKCLWENLF